MTAAASKADAAAVPTADAAAVPVADCKAWCVHACNELNGESIASECGGCDPSDPRYVCRPTTAGFAEQTAPRFLPARAHALLVRRMLEPRRIGSAEGLDEAQRAVALLAMRHPNVTAPQHQQMLELVSYAADDWLRRPHEADATLAAPLQALLAALGRWAPDAGQPAQRSLGGVWHPTQEVADAVLLFGERHGLLSHRFFAGGRGRHWRPTARMLEQLYADPAAAACSSGSDGAPAGVARIGTGAAQAAVEALHPDEEAAEAGVAVVDDFLPPALLAALASGFASSAFFQDQFAPEPRTVHRAQCIQCIQCCAAHATGSRTGESSRPSPIRCTRPPPTWSRP